MFHSSSATNELKVIRYLDHPNLIRYQNYFMDEDRLYFAMELYHCNLLSFISNTNLKSSKTLIKQIFKQICLGVQHLHSEDYSHTNLKLEHVLIKKEDTIRVVLIDFNNMVKCKDGDKITKRELIRNPNYAAPELLMDKPYEPKPADCWALGTILYTLITGRLPFRSK